VQKKGGPILTIYTSYAGQDDDIGVVGKCLGPATSKGPTKDGCKIFWTYASQSVSRA